MPSKPRSEIFDPDQVGVYHCWNRVVQRRHLFGFDQLTGKDYSYRKLWLKERLQEIATVFAVDILDYAILDNHLHLVMRNRPDIVEQWDDREVAHRWWVLCPERKNSDGSAATPREPELRCFEQHADEYRKRLSSISWVMRLLCQPIARRANREDDVDGRFFAKRFECNRLETDAEVLACSLYVDLNAIHAGIADTPEESEFTSAFDRIHARWRVAHTELKQHSNGKLDDESQPDTFLAPIFLNESAETYRAIEKAVESNPIGSARTSNKGFLPLTVCQYLALLDCVGRTVRTGKRGHIPHDLPPILSRLNLQMQTILDSVVDFFTSRSAFREAPIPS
jgi:REP element-mobilizing transposase RayT